MDCASIPAPQAAQDDARQPGGDDERHHRKHEPQKHVSSLSEARSPKPEAEARIRSPYPKPEAEARCPKPAARSPKPEACCIVCPMLLTPLDWVIVAASVVVSFVPALLLARRAGSSTAEFFTSGQAAPWWLVGVSMVATTFSTDTPNLVTNLVREGGVAANWAWWAFLLTGHDHRVLLRAAVAPAGRAHRSRVLRDAVLRPSGDVRPRVSRGLPRAAVQLRHHGDGQPGGRQDRQRAARLADGADADCLRRPEHRVCRDLRPLGRAW